MGPSSKVKTTSLSLSGSVGILHAADAGIFGRIEREDAARAERVGMSRTVGGGLVSRFVSRLRCGGFGSGLCCRGLRRQLLRENQIGA